MEVIYLQLYRIKFHVGGLLGINDTWFRYRGSISNINNAEKNGVYAFASNAENDPSDGSGKCFVFNGGQILVTWDSRKIYIRGSIDLVWKQIATI